VRTTRFFQVLGFFVILAAWQNIHAQRLWGEEMPGEGEGEGGAAVCETASGYCVGKDDKFFTSGKGCKILRWGTDCVTCLLNPLEATCVAPGGKAHIGYEIAL